MQKSFRPAFAEGQGLPDTVLLTHTLPNGVRVVAEQVPGVRSIAAGVWVDVGSRDETPEEAGITHFLSLIHI